MSEDFDLNSFIGIESELKQETTLKNALKSKKMTEVLNFSPESSLILRVLKPQSLRRHSLDRERKQTTPNFE